MGHADCLRSHLVLNSKLMEVLNMKLLKNDTVVANDRIILSKWETGDITTTQARRRIADANNLDINFVTEKEFFHLARMCGYWRNGLSYKSRFFPE